MRKIFLLVVMLSSSAAIAVDAQSIINKMRYSMDHLNYQGTYLYKINNHFDTIRLQHVYNEHHHLERLTSLTGEAREVVRTDKQVSCLMPEKNLLLIDRSRNQFSAINQYKFLPEHLSPHYQVKLGEEERVAGKLAYKVIIKPMDNYRYGHTLWIDKVDFLLLKTTMNLEDKIIEEILFTDIQPIEKELANKLLAEKDFDKQLSVKNNTSHKTPEKNSGWSFKNTPPGYKLQFFMTKPLQNRKGKVKQWLFSDGMASYSVFIQDLNNIKSVPENVVNIGAVHVLSLIRSPWLITIMGEVPEKTILYASKNIEEASH